MRGVKSLPEPPPAAEEGALESGSDQSGAATSPRSRRSSGDRPSRPLTKDRTRPSKAPAVSKGPSKAAAISAHPAKAAAVSAQPSKAAAVSTRPSKAAAVRALPSKAAAVSTQPSKAATANQSTAAVGRSKVGEKARPSQEKTTAVNNRKSKDDGHHNSIGSCVGEKGRADLESSKRLSGPGMPRQTQHRTPRARKNHGIRAVSTPQVLK